MLSLETPHQKMQKLALNVNQFFCIQKLDENAKATASARNCCHHKNFTQRMTVPLTLS